MCHASQFAGARNRSSYPADRAADSSRFSLIRPALSLTVPSANCCNRVVVATSIGPRCRRSPGCWPSGRRYFRRTVLWVVPHPLIRSPVAAQVAGAEHDVRLSSFALQGTPSWRWGTTRHRLRHRAGVPRAATTQEPGLPTGHRLGTRHGHGGRHLCALRNARCEHLRDKATPPLTQEEP